MKGILNFVVGLIKAVVIIGGCFFLVYAVNGGVVIMIAIIILGVVKFFVFDTKW